MGKFIAIGGADIRNYDRKIDEFALDLIEKTETKPRVLFLPQANGESKPSVNTFYKIYGKLKTKPSCVLFKNGEMDEGHIAEKFETADLIYIGGGNLLRLLREFAKMKIDAMLKKASERGAVIVGNSAGALYLFSRGVSDCGAIVRKSENSEKAGNNSEVRSEACKNFGNGISEPEASYFVSKTLSEVEGLGFIDAAFTPHADSERRKMLKKTAEKYALADYALEESEAMYFETENGKTVRAVKLDFK